MAATSVFVELRANISEFQAKMGEARSEVQKMGKTSESNFSKLSTVGKAALTGIAGLAIGVGAGAIEMADQFEVSHARLGAALSAAGSSFKDIQGPLSATESAMEKFGYTNATVEDSVSRLVTAQGAHINIQKEETLAANIAAARHIDLASATDMVNKAYAGNSRALKAMGIDLPIAAGGALKVKQAQDAVQKATDAANAILAKTPDAVNPASKAHAAYETALANVKTAQQKLNDAQNAGTQIVDALTQRFGGQAATAADTFGGKLKAAKAQGEDLLKNIGMRLIPVLERMMTVTMGVVTWLEKHKAVAIALGAVIGGAVLAAITAYVAEMAIAVAETLTMVVTAVIPAISFFFAMAVAVIAATWPILLIIAAIALLVVGVIELIKHWSTVAAFFAEVWDEIKHVVMVAVDAVVGFLKRAWDDVWGAIKAAWDKITQFFRDFWPLLLVIMTGGVALIPLLLIKYWNQIWADLQTAWQVILNFFRNLGNTIITLLGDLTRIGAKIIGDIGRGIGDLAGWASGIFSKLGGYILSGIGDLGSIGKSIINSIIGGIDDGINAINNNIPSVFGVRIFPTLPDIPKLAKGGRLAAGQTALVGEQGPELITPGSSSTVIPNSALTGGGGQMAHVAVAVQLDGVTFAQMTQTALLRYNRTAGPLGIK